MANKKTNKGKAQQAFLSPENYIKQKARTLPIWQCYMSDSIEMYGEGYVIVPRLHTGGNVTVGLYLVDTYCLGVKDTFYRFRCDEKEYLMLLQSIRHNMGLKEVSYEEAHNMLYGAIEFAEEAGIKPHKDFAITRYILDEDTDEIPLIEYDYGKDGKHFLVAHSNMELSKYLPLLKKNLGDKFDYVLEDGNDDEDDYYGGDDENENAENEKTEYTYKHPEYPSELKIENPIVTEILDNPDNADYLNVELTDKLLALPCESLRRDLENVILYNIGLTCDIKPDEMEEGEFIGNIGLAIVLLAEVGNEDSSIDVVLEVLRQSENFLEYHICDFGTEIISMTLYKLAHNRLDKLIAFIKEEGLVCRKKFYAIHAMRFIFMNYPEKRDEIIDIYREIINYFVDNHKRLKITNNTLNSLIVCELVDIRAKELLPEIKALYKNNMVYIFVCEGYSDVEKDINNPEEDNYVMPKDEIHERFAEIKRKIG